MPQQIVLATGNKGKVKELATMLAPFNMTIIPQNECDVPEADETGTTFVENAIIKARNAAKHTGLPAIADDSGLEVDYLNGQPGIYSARYAGASAKDGDNVVKLLDALKGVTKEQRSARFHCVLVYMRHAEDPTPLIFHGSWEGQITEQASGTEGFGYDPVFNGAEYSCTAAQLTPEKKNQLSHRGKALRLLTSAMQPTPV